MGPGRTMFERADAMLKYWIYKFMPLYAASYTGGVCCIHIGEIFSVRYGKEFTAVTFSFSARDTNSALGDRGERIDGSD